MKIEEISLPEGWVEHEHYARAARGVIAAYRTEDWGYFIDVIEYKAHISSNFKVELRAASVEKYHTLEVEHKNADTYDEVEKAILQLAREHSCN